MADFYDITTWNEKPWNQTSGTRNTAIKCFQNIHSQAKALQQEAARVLEEAKREIEKMISGE